MKVIALLCLLLCIPSGMAATIGQLLFERLDVQALPNNSVTALVQDHTGYLWIGTQNGLVRHDGYNYQTHFSQSPAQDLLATSYIRALMVDKEKRLWIGTMADGLFVYHSQTGQIEHIRHRKNQPDGLPGNRIESIAPDGEDGVWLGTYQGLVHYQPNEKTFTRHVHDPDNPESLNHNQIRTLLLADNGTLWIGSWQGLNILQPGSNRFFTVTDPQGQLAQRQVFRLYQSRDGRIWVGTFDNGVIVHDPKKQSFVHLPKGQNQLSHSLIMAFAEPLPNQIWIGTFGGGIDILDQTTLQVIRRVKVNPMLKTALADNNIGALLIDRDDILWVGTWGFGLNRFNVNNKAFHILRHSLSGERHAGLLNHPDTFSVLETADRLWVGTRGKGITVLDTTHQRRIEVPKLAVLDNHQIKSLHESPDGDIWIGTIADGLYRYQPGSDKLSHYTIDNGLPNSLIETIISDEDGRIWLGTDGGLALLTPDNGQIKVFVHKADDPNTLPGNVVETLAIDGQKRVWAGTHKGLALITPDLKVRRIVKDEARDDSLSHNHINSLLVDSNDTLWVATSKGIDLLQFIDDNGARFVSVNKVTGEPPGWRENLLEDNLGRIWALVDSKSLLMIEQDPWRATRFDTPDGVNFGNSWTNTCFKGQRGHLYFGGTEGLMRVTPELATPTKVEAPIVFTRFAVNNRPRQPSTLMQGLTLMPEDRQFSVEFAALNYLKPHQIQYDHRLLGFSDQWTRTDAAHRQIAYTNLAPGEYRLQVRSVSPDGAPHNNLVTTRITVVPGFVQSLSFKVMVIFVVLLVMHLLLRWRTYALDQKARALHEKVTKRTSELETLAEIGKELNATLDIQSISDRLHQHVKTSLKADVFALAIIDTEQQLLQFSNVIEDNEPLPPFALPLTNTEHLAVHCVNMQYPVVLYHFEEAVKYLGIPTKPMAGDAMNSVIYQPLAAHDGNVIGCITVQCRAPSSYSESNVELLGILASYTAIALDNARTYQALEDQSKTDYLTGLPNRRAFFDAAQTMVARANRNLTPFALVLTDIDHFKQFNDTYGHDAGDFVLQRVAEILKGTIRAQDFVARWGGEEFIFLFADTGLPGATVAAEKVRNAIEQAMFDYEGQRFEVTMTFGIALFSAGEDLSERINQADTMLYTGKQQGRNRVVCEDEPD